MSTGFTPDPMRLTGQTRAASPLAARASSCRGFAGDAPDHRILLESRFGFLRFFVVAAEDVTLAIRGPNGWQCAGRRLGGAPREEGVFEAGEYEVWIGSAEGRPIAYDLHVTEFQSVTPTTGRAEEAPISGGADIGLDVRAETGRFRDRRFRRGFLPDPREDNGRAGGAIDAALLGGGCRGRVDAQPSHIVTMRTAFDYFRVEVTGATGHATLVIRAPDGGYFCSAPDEIDAFVENSAWSPGRYLIWVGSRAVDETPEYTIVYTETRPRAR